MLAVFILCLHFKVKTRLIIVQKIYLCLKTQIPYNTTSLPMTSKEHNLCTPYFYGRFHGVSQLWKYWARDSLSPEIIIIFSVISHW